jgi:endonuclease/exonuclease/phosphatase family metal-dependent hydrolase
MIILTMLYQLNGKFKRQVRKFTQISSSHFFTFYLPTMKKIFTFILCLLSLFSGAQSIRIITYNIRLDYVGDGINQWPNRKTKVFDLIRTYDPDIFGVQEAVPGQMEDLSKNLPLYRAIGVGRDDGKNQGEFSAIFYKKESYDLLDQNTFWLSETPEIAGSKSWDAAITRIATWARFRDKKTAKEFIVINTHFDHIGKEARKKSAELLKQKANELTQGLPLIITGDFNCTRDEPPYHIMMDKSGIELFDSAPKNPPGTYCGFEVNAMECKAIDYIFYSKHWKVKTYKVLTDNDGKYYPSDHLPVRAEFKTPRN